MPVIVIEVLYIAKNRQEQKTEKNRDVKQKRLDRTPLTACAMSLSLKHSASESRPPALQEAVTWRALAIGLVVLVLADLYINWGTLLLRASKLNKSYFPMGLFFPFAALAGVNLLLWRCGLRRVLNRGEMQVVLGMGLIGAFFPFFGLAGFLVGIVAAPFYLATPENGWQELLHGHIPSWIVLHNEDFAATWFYEGLPAGQSIPWKAWAVPLFWWLSFVGAIGWTILCVMVMLRKQWVEHERLEYPLVSVGMHLAASPNERSGLPTMLSSRSFRVAFVLGLVAVGWNVGSYFWPLVPSLPTVPTSGRWFRWMDRAPRFWAQVSIYIIGFAYFARVEALFSFWMFFVLTGIEVSVFDRIGVGSSVGQGGVEAVRSQSFGALCTLALASLWMARGHLRAVVRKAVRGDPSVDDSGEALSYRTAAVGLVIGLGYMAGWLHLAGLEISVLIPYLFLAMMAYIGLSRVVAEVGLPYANISDTALNWTPIYLLGSRTISAPTLVCQGFMYSLFATTRGFLGPPLAQMLKLTTGLSFKRNRLVGAILLALLAGFLVSVLHTIYLGYLHGGYNLGAWSLINGSRRSYQNAVTWIRNPQPPDVDRLTFTASGILLTVLLTYLKYRFIRWPLPAVGLALQGMYMARRIVFPVFLAWAYKSIILKVGGVQMYRRGQPFFIGLMVGYAVGVFCSTLIDQVFFWGRGHSVHDF